MKRHWATYAHACNGPPEKKNKREDPRLAGFRLVKWANYAIVSKQLWQQWERKGVHKSTAGTLIEQYCTANWADSIMLWCRRFKHQHAPLDTSPWVLEAEFKHLIEHLQHQILRQRPPLYRILPVTKPRAESTLIQSTIWLLAALSQVHGHTDDFVYVGGTLIKLDEAKAAFAAVTTGYPEHQHCKIQFISRKQLCSAEYRKTLRGATTLFITIPLANPLNRANRKLPQLCVTGPAGLTLLGYPCTLK